MLAKQLPALVSKWTRAEALQAAITAGESIASINFLQVALISISSQVSNILLQHQVALAGKVLSIASRRPLEIPSKVPIILQCAA